MVGDGRKKGASDDQEEEFNVMTVLLRYDEREKINYCPSILKSYLANTTAGSESTVYI